VNRYPLIAKEGMLPLLAASLAAVMVLHFIGFWPSLIFWILGLLVLLLFRDPERDIPSIPLAVVSPADGRITSVSMVQDPYLERASIRVTLQMTPYGVFTTRSPVEGKVLEPPNLPESADTPHGVWLKTDAGDDVVMVMNMGRLKNEPRCYVRFGDRIGQGKRCGFIHLGGKIDLYLPEASRMLVTTGDWVRSGSDVIAKLVHA